MNYNQRINRKAELTTQTDFSSSRLFNAGPCLRQDYKVFILSLNGLAGNRNEKEANSALRVKPLSRKKLLAFRIFLRILRVLGYRQQTVSEATSRQFGRFFCPVIDIHDDKSYSEFLAIKNMFIHLTVCVAPGFLSKHKLVDRIRIWNELREMAASGTEMGLAGYRYINLTSLGHAAQRAEISRSAHIIGERTNSKPKIAAFPAGTFDTTTISCCRESGITLGISHRGLFEIEGTTGLLGPRITAAALSLKVLASLLAFNYKRSVSSRARGLNDSRDARDETTLTKASTGAR